MGYVLKLVISSWPMLQPCHLWYQYELQGHNEGSHTCISVGIVLLRTCSNTSGCGHATLLLHLCNAQQECESSAPEGHLDKELAHRREQGKNSPPK